MDFALDEGQRLLLDALEGTVKRVSPPERVQRLDNLSAFDADLHRAIADLGVLGLGVPEADGGSGGGPLEQILALEVLGRTATSMAVFLVVHYIAMHLLLDFGNPAQRQAHLPALCRGERKFSFCLTEPGGGTDVLGAIRTSARRQGEGWRLNGTKQWISGAGIADQLIVLARTAEHRTRGLTMFLLPKASPGLRVAERATLGIHGYDTNEVAFEEVELPRAAVLGAANAGFQQVLATLNAERLHAAAVATGIGRGACQVAVAHAKSRAAFGRPIGQFQAVQHRLVRASLAVEAAWLLTLRAAGDAAAGRPAELNTSMAKLAAAEAAVQATQAGMETLAGAGFDLDLPMQRYFRDARLYVFAPITNDMVANFLGERWLGLPRSF
ncbi:MAG: acyl-CoA dehydrogenase [Alphaproteobacteria bacterium]|nr:acyl-CoA dehydrogenase [Alphaproteobacteria bacterium]